MDLLETYNNQVESFSNAEHVDYDAHSDHSDHMSQG